MADKDGAGKKSKISVYLLKDGVTEDDFLIEPLVKQEIEGVGTVYTSQIPIDAPSWVESFFSNKIEGLHKGGAGAILKVPVVIGEEQKEFLLSFGYGFHKVNVAACEERFGLKVVLNAGNLKSGVKSIDRKNLSSSPKLSREQTARSEGITSYGIDYEQDIIQSLTLESTDNILGKTISGNTSLIATTAFDISDIKALLPKLYEYYQSDKYKKEKYDWIDHVSEAPKSYTATLNNKLLEILNAYTDDNQTCHFSPPELQDWDDVVGFGPSSKNDDLVKDSICFDDYRRDRQGQSIVFDDIKQIKTRRVYLWSALHDSSTRHWNLFSCIYAEVPYDGRVFMLSNGKWYVVNDDYSKVIDAWYSKLPIQESPFDSYEKITYTDEKTGKEKTKHSEEQYNQNVAAKSDYLCLDRKLISVGPRKDIEACDLFKKGEFMHVKIFTGSSSPISHLMAQATVSADLFFGDRQFREELNKKLPDGNKLTEQELAQPDHSGYKVTLAVITNRDNLQLPFFSRVNLRSALRRLETMGIKVEVSRIKGNF